MCRKRVDKCEEKILDMVHCCGNVHDWLHAS